MIENPIIKKRYSPDMRARLEAMKDICINITLTEFEHELSERRKRKEMCVKHKGQRCIGYPTNECMPCIAEILS